MATAFDTFNQYAFGNYAGQLEDRSMADVVSRLASGSDIGYGLAVIDTGERTAELPTGSEVSNGITLREVVRDNAAGDNPTPVYAEDHEMSVVRVGRVWVATDGGSAIGEQVYVIPATGELTNVEGATPNIAMPGATFKTVAAAGELALVQLNGN